MGGYVFSLHHVAPLTASVGLAPKALLYYHELAPGHSTDSSLLLVGRDRGRQESFLSHLFLFLSKYRCPLPQGNEMQKKKTNKESTGNKKKSFPWFAMQFVFSCPSTHVCSGRKLLSRKIETQGKGWTRPGSLSFYSLADICKRFSMFISIIRGNLPQKDSHCTYNKA